MKEDLGISAYGVPMREQSLLPVGTKRSVYWKANLSYEERLQLLAFLTEIAKSDGNVCAAEINALKEVAMAMGKSDREVEYMVSLKGNSLDDAYKMLEIEPTATDEEVRTAYRRMAENISRLIFFKSFTKRSL